MKAQDIGLTIITSEAQGWKKGLANVSLAEALRENKIKYTYTDEMFEEEEVVNMIEKNSIELKECFSTMDNVIFKKLRSGLTRIHSPSGQTDSRRRTSSREK